MFACVGVAGQHLFSVSGLFFRVTLGLSSHCGVCSLYFYVSVGVAGGAEWGEDGCCLLVHHISKVQNGCVMVDSPEFILKICFIKKTSEAFRF